MGNNVGQIAALFKPHGPFHKMINVVRYRESSPQPATNLTTTSSMSTYDKVRQQVDEVINFLADFVNNIKKYLDSETSTTVEPQASSINTVDDDFAEIPQENDVEPQASSVDTATNNQSLASQENTDTEDKYFTDVLRDFKDALITADNAKPTPVRFGYSFKEVELVIKVRNADETTKLKIIELNDEHKGKHHFQVYLQRPDKPDLRLFAEPNLSFKQIIDALN